ncbi:MAG: CRISPR-associated endonuclease Cas2 [Blastocatellia bacterium]|nr:CRISPR-associated endonuclease Cas2 [Blastocatellia bacterium]MCS7158700.1 CRISPR-associated endonuclease Cas2 [Blastocatellia bacterium]MCX7753165.1 CRISPR-associated endonuclease Cas2 [Blastocatellia bacterium]MDW8168202.1 CRISPR-associated endonuclease Cas2 [Acidobacteriota bacterium]MDW8257801.1 CRISPR-associated endonuclease Cas2 [Acidobacteriota bacterium]
MPIKRVMFYIISYDISDDKRRTQVSEILKDFGTRVQYSVFECLLTEDQFLVLLRRLRSHIDPATDSLRCYRLCQGCVDEIIVEGRGDVTREEDVYIW